MNRKFKIYSVVERIASLSIIACAELSAVDSITLENVIQKKVDPRLFGQFMEVAGSEPGPEAAVSDGSRTLRPEVEAKIKAMNIPVIRFPGGLLVETPDWRWTHRVDNAYDRLQKNRSEKYPFGYDEFLGLCERQGTEPMLVIKLADIVRGLLSPEDIVGQAQSLVAYCNLPVDSPRPEYLTRWALLREKNGRKQPWNVKYWQVGNEFTWVAVDRLRKQGWPDLRIADEYVEAVAKVIEAIRRVDPDIETPVEVNMEELGVNVIDKLHRRLGKLINYMTTHKYYSWEINRLLKDGEPVGFDQFKPRDYLLAAASAPGCGADGQGRFNPNVFALANQLGYPLAITEWNWNSWWGLKVPEGTPPPFPEPLWAKGVAASPTPNALLRDPREIAIATQSMLLGSKWELRGINVANGRCAYHPTAMATTLYNLHHGDRVMKWNGTLDTYKQNFTVGQLEPSAEVAYIDCVVTADDRQIYLHLINRDFDHDRTLEMDSSALIAPDVTEAGHFLLTGTLDDRELCEKGKEAARLEIRKAGRDSGKKWRLKLPPRNVQVITISKSNQP